MTDGTQVGTEPAEATPEAPPAAVAAPPAESTEPEKDQILFVDDEPNVLSAIRRTMGSRYQLFLGNGGEEGLEILEANPRIAVVVSDMRMPGMNGAEFLAATRELRPDTSRLLLTGQTDMDTALKAVNEGQIFRFLTKPAPPDQLKAAVASALEQHRLVTGRKALLEKTLKGAIDLLVDVLSLSVPIVFQRGKLMEKYVRHMAAHFEMPDAYKFEMAALLALVGHVTIPPDVVERGFTGHELDDQQQRMLAEHPQTAFRLLKKIPELEQVAEMVRDQCDASIAFNPEFPVPAGAAMLRTAFRMATLVELGSTPKEAIAAMNAEGGHDFYLLDALASYQDTADGRRIQLVQARQLVSHMVLDQDLRTKDGRLLLPRGRELSSTVLQRIRNFEKEVGLEEPIRVISLDLELDGQPEEAEPAQA